MHKCWSVIILSFIFALPVLADGYNQGVDLYNHGHYRQAYDIFPRSYSLSGNADSIKCSNSRELERDKQGPSAPGGIAGYVFCLLEITDKQIDLIKDLQF